VLSYNNELYVLRDIILLVKISVKLVYEVSLPFASPFPFNTGEP
jgi:hypothetical protein